MVAPGEKIISCQSSNTPAAPATANAATAADAATAAPADSQAAATPASAKANIQIAYYKEDSGTSMATPHVSGVIAAFLSVRREFIGKPEQVKDVFMSTATDLKRAVYFQGKGLVDLMRAIQSV
jgi:subtilisin family serine protease